MKEIYQRNCKNCGSPLEHSYNHKCPYCGTLYDFNEPNVVEVKAEDLVNIRLRQIEIASVTNSLILYFDGYKCEMPKVYEYDGKNTYVSKVETYINPPKCGFCIEISIPNIEKYGWGYVKDIIARSGIRYNELDDVINQVRDNINDFFVIRYQF